jgi:hypothetical protein
VELVTAQNIFAVRLYEWSRLDFIHELEEGCPLLSSIGLNDRSIAAFVMWNETLTFSQRRSLAVALTKRSHENAARLKQEVLTEEDKCWAKALYDHTWHGFQEEHVPPLLTAFRGDPCFQPLDPEICLNTLVSSLSPTMGTVSRRGLKVISKKWIGDWKVLTEFTLSLPDEQLSFVYQFIRKDGLAAAVKPHPARGPFPRTLLLFYGLGFTTVQVPSKIDGQRMATVISKLAEHFVGQAGALFEGLGINDPEDPMK